MADSNTQYSNFLQSKGSNAQVKMRSDTIGHKPLFSFDFNEAIPEDEVNSEEKTMGKDEFNVFLKIYFELVLDMFLNRNQGIS